MRHQAKGTHQLVSLHRKDVGVETRGYDNLERQIRSILPEQKEADSLLVVEVFTPDGHWSSYPPHKHDRDALPEESSAGRDLLLPCAARAEEYAIQRIYADDRSVDETLVSGEQW